MGCVKKYCKKWHFLTIFFKTYHLLCFYKAGSISSIIFTLSRTFQGLFPSPEYFIYVSAVRFQILRRATLVCRNVVFVYHLLVMGAPYLAMLLCRLNLISSYPIVFCYSEPHFHNIASMTPRPCRLVAAFSLALDQIRAAA